MRAADAAIAPRLGECGLDAVPPNEYGLDVGSSTKGDENASKSAVAIFPASSIFTARRCTSYCRFASSELINTVYRRSESHISAARFLSTSRNTRTALDRWARWALRAATKACQLSSQSLRAALAVWDATAAAWRRFSMRSAVLMLAAPNPAGVPVIDARFHMDRSFEATTEALLLPEIMLAWSDICDPLSLKRSSSMAG
jgi:hypothetical protein